MTFLHGSLLIFGGLLAVVPIVLHLVMRQQPRPLLFPALQLLMERRETNRRKMQLKHWLLLILRCGAVLLLAMLLARPSVLQAATGYGVAGGIMGAILLVVLLILAVAWYQQAGRLMLGLLGLVALLLLVNIVVMGWRAAASRAGLADSSAPVAAAFVFDTSERMNYRYNNQTRLEEAKEQGRWFLKQLPLGSDLAVAHGQAGEVVFAIDLGAADKAIQTLETTGVPVPLTDLIERAIQLVRQSDKPRKEVYVFSDLSEAAWPERQTARLREQLGEKNDVSLLVLDVGAPQPHNFALSQPHLSRQVLSRGGQVRIETELTHLGDGGTVQAVLLLEQDDPRLPRVVDGKPELPAKEQKAFRQCTVGRNGSMRLQFSLDDLPPGTHHGVISIDSSDPLPIDDRRYFTVEVRPAWPVLIVRGAGAVADYLVDSLAPYELRQRDEARFRCDVITTEQWAEKELSDYAAVCFLDPAELSPDVCTKLSAYVEQGGGLAFFLGRNARKASLDAPAAQKLLPGPLERQWRRPDGDVFLSLAGSQHPIIQAFRPVATSVPWNRYPIFRYWQLDPVRPGTAVAMRLSNGRPILFENVLGQGRILTCTTPISDPANQPERPDPWNRLPTGLEPWPFVVLSNEMMLYLVGQGNEQLNYEAGQSAVLPKLSPRDPDRYQLFTPRGDWYEITAQEGTITVRFTEMPGAYRIKTGRTDEPARGFAVNLSDTMSRLQRVSEEMLQGWMKDARFRVTRDRVEIQRSSTQQTQGSELYSTLTLLAALVLGLEYLTANRFYRRS